MVFRRPPRHDPHTRQPRTLTTHRRVPAGRQVVLVALAGLLALTLSACGSSGATTTGDTPAAAASNGEPTVTVKDMAYTPERLTVAAGATVTWVFGDGAIAHDVKGDGFQSKVMAKGTFRHRFTQPGTYQYLCTLHPNMTATIEVTR
jgi:plastocyanin